MKKVRILIITTVIGLSITSGAIASILYTKMIPSVVVHGEVVTEQKELAVDKKEDDDLSKLEALQPGKFKGGFSDLYAVVPIAPYHEILRYPTEHAGKNYSVSGTVKQVNFVEGEGVQIYIKDELAQQEIYLQYAPTEDQQNVLVGDKINVFAEFQELITVESINGFGASKPKTEPCFFVYEILGNDFYEGKTSLESFLDKEGLYNWELVGSSKDFDDLKDKRGYVFALKSKSEGKYQDYYIYAERNEIRYFTPTINSKNIKGENVSLQTDTIRY